MASTYATINDVIAEILSATAAEIKPRAERTAEDYNVILTTDGLVIARALRMLAGHVNHGGLTVSAQEAGEPFGDEAAEWFRRVHERVQAAWLRLALRGAHEPVLADLQTYLIVTRAAIAVSEQRSGAA